MTVLRMPLARLMLAFLLGLASAGIGAAGEHGDPAAAFVAARALQDAGRVTEAIDAYREVIRRFPHLPEAYNNLAVLLAKQGDMAEARRVLLAGMETSERYAAIYRNLNAITLEQARESYLKALRLGRNPPAPELIALDAPPVEVAAAPRTPPASPAATPAETPAASAPEPAPPGGLAATDADAATAAGEGDEAITLAAAPDLTRVVADPLATRRQSITDALQAWAAAWSARDADLYLSFYSRSFVPAGGQSRARWAQQRRQRVTRPRWIKVALEDIRIEVADDFHAVVRLRQHYRAENYEDVTLKRLTLKHEADGWRIAREQSLRTLR